MLIAASSVQMSSLRLASQAGNQTQRALASAAATVKPAAGQQLVLTQEAEYQLSLQQQTQVTATSTVTSANADPLQLQRQQLLQQSLQVALQGQAALTAVQALGGADGPKVSGEVKLGFQQHQFVYSSERTLISAQGNIATADGRSIDFTLYLQLQRSAAESSNQSLSIQARAFHDPLVINFGAEAVTLSDQSFQFDLNGDGQTEQLAQLGAGSGFLAFDRNGDGTINNGSELFGASSGNGFADLAQFDVDGNGWIDGNDPIFQQLQVLTFNSDGSQSLKSLAEVGVGALYLDAASGNFDLVNSHNQVLGRIRSSGIYLTENGAVRTLQQVDLAAQENPPDDPPTLLNQVLASTPAAAAQPAPTATPAIDLSKLQAIRDSQKQYNEQLKKDLKQEKSPLQILLDKMFEQQRAFLQRRLRDQSYRQAAADHGS